MNPIEKKLEFSEQHQFESAPQHLNKPAVNDTPFERLLMHSILIIYVLLSVVFIAKGSTPYPSNYPTSLSSCPAGEGITNSSCVICPIGTWNDGSSTYCITCTDAPSHSYYTSSGWTTSNCPYQCDAGHATALCVTPFDEAFLKAFGNYLGTPIEALVFFVLLCFFSCIPRICMKCAEFEPIDADIIEASVEISNVIHNA